MADEFNLRALVRDVLESSTLADPTDVANEVMRRIPKSSQRAALVQALRAFVRQVISEQRMSIRITDGQPTLPVVGSAKVAARREWAQALRLRVAGLDGWKSLADCTYADLLHAAKERREQARRNSAKARQYELLASLLTEHSADRVRDLPQDVLRNAFEAAA